MNENPYFWAPLAPFLVGLSVGYFVRFVMGSITAFLGPRPSAL